jgi:uncharacterized protein involved in outer membrane biogenesis
MKKLLLRIALALVVLLIAGIVVLTLNLDRGIKKVVETVGPQITQVPVTLDGVSLSVFSGSGALKGLTIGNPDGYKTPEAMSVGLASLAVKPSSIFSDKIVVKHIRIEAPKITFELGPGGNNLQRIQKNLEAASGGGSPATPADPAPAKETGPGKKLQVDEVVVTGGVVTFGVAALGGKVYEAPLPEVRLEKLGQGPEGITAAELGKVILSKINQTAIETYGDKLAEASAAALNELTARATNAVNEATSDAIQNATKKLDKLFKK